MRVVLPPTAPAEPQSAAVDLPVQSVVYFEAPHTYANPLDALLQRAISQTTDTLVQNWLRHLLGGQYATNKDAASKDENPRRVATKENTAVSNGASAHGDTSGKSNGSSPRRNRRGAT